MKQYLDLLQKVLDTGTKTDDRTGVGTIAIFGEQIKFDLREGFPVLTTKKMAWKAIVSELLWFLSGSDNVNDLRAIQYGEDKRFDESCVTIWDANVKTQGDALGYQNGFAGSIYGTQWRNFHNFNGLDGADQIVQLISDLKTNPSSRRHLVVAWNPNAVGNYTEGYGHAINHAVLPPCHYAFQVNIDGDFIDLMWVQRSIDSFLGLGFNISSYALLLSILGKLVNKTPRHLIGSLGNVHIYNNHIDQVKTQLLRDPLPLPTLVLPEFDSLEDLLKLRPSEFKLEGYSHHEKISAQMAV